MPPGTGDVQLTITQSVKLTGAVIITTPHGLSLVDTARGILMFEKVNVPILGVIENMAFFIAPDTGKKHYIFGEQKGGALSTRFGIKTLSEVPVQEQLSGNIPGGQPNPFIQKAADGLLRAIHEMQSTQPFLKDAGYRDGRVVLVLKAWSMLQRSRRTSIPKKSCPWAIMPSASPGATNTPAVFTRTACFLMKKTNKTP
jgi:hypothetical protein